MFSDRSKLITSTHHIILTRLSELTSTIRSAICDPKIRQDVIGAWVFAATEYIELVFILPD